MSKGNTMLSDEVKVGLQIENKCRDMHGEAQSRVRWSDSNTEGCTVVDVEKSCLLCPAGVSAACRYD